MRLDHQFAALGAALVLLSLLPGTSRTAVTKETAPAQTAGTGPSVLTPGELEKLHATDPVAWERLQALALTPVEMLAAQLVAADSTAAAQAAAPGVACDAALRALYELLQKDGPVTTIVVGPPGLTEQETNKLQTGTHVAPASR